MINEQWENEWKDYYKILGVDRNANEKIIKKKYRKLMTKYHPDNHMNDSEEEKKIAEEKAKEIIEAYEILIDKEKKKRYDAAWDEVQKTGTYTGQKSTTNSDNTSNNTQNSNVNSDDFTFEEAQTEYTAEEKRYAKRLALKEVIREEIEKIDVIINAKNELIYNGFASKIDKREYYTSVKELVSVGYEFIGNLNNLAKEAFKYDLLEEEEILYDCISNLENELKNIPLTPEDAKSKIMEDVYKEKVKEKLENEIITSKEEIEKLSSILIYVSRKEITHLDYKTILSNILFEAKDCASKLKELIKIAHSLELEEETKALDALNNLSSKIQLMPEDYESAVILGSVEEKKEKLRELINECTQFEIKLHRIIKVLDKHPNSKYYEKVCNTTLTNTKEKVEYLIEEHRTVSKPLSPSSMNIEKAQKLSKKGFKLYELSEEEHFKANKIYNDNIQVIKEYQNSEFANTQITEELINNGVILALTKSAVSLLDKNKAFDLFVEAGVLLEVLSNFNNKDSELENLLETLKSKINSLKDIIDIFDKLLKEYEKRKAYKTQNNSHNVNSTNSNSNQTASNTNPNHSNSSNPNPFNSSNFNLSSIEELKEYLEELKKEMNILLKKLQKGLLIPVICGFYPVVTTLDGIPNTGIETLLSLFLTIVTAGSIINETRLYDKYKELNELKMKTNNELTLKLIADSNKNAKVNSHSKFLR